MKPIGVFYATRQGHTQRVAEHVAATLRARGLEADVSNLRDRADGIVLDKYAGAVLAASIHLGKHEPEMIRFVKQHRPELEMMSTAFLSVNLTEAGVEDTNATPEQHTQSVALVQGMLDTFSAKTGWHPQRAKAVAGALLYTKYNFLLRFVMQQIAKKGGKDTDTSRDYEYTDWAVLDRFVEEFAAEIPCEIFG